MISGSPREVNLISKTSGELLRVGGNMQDFIDEVLQHFSAIAERDDMITISTYEDGEYVYLDLSRHRKNFPSVEKVAGFGKYQPAGEALRNRSADRFLRFLGDECHYTFDRFSQSPSYLSFKFPLSTGAVISVRDKTRKVRILAIDDQSIILELLIAMCQSQDYDIETALSGREGIQLASQADFDIVLTDLAMPEMSGLETARNIKKLLPNAPIILLTGWETKIDQDQLELSGITKVLYKPFRIEQLTDIIQSVVPSRSHS
jgi:CheY-like chemotaxis protein